MHTLNRYYSYIKNPYSTHFITGGDRLILVVHPPVFILTVNDSSHSQITDMLTLFFFVARYYFIFDNTLVSEKYVNTEVSIRGPPQAEV